MIDQVLALIKLEVEIKEAKSIPAVGEVARSTDGYPCLVTHVERIESQMGFPYYVIAGMVTTPGTKTQVAWMLLRPAEEVATSRREAVAA